MVRRAPPEIAEDNERTYPERRLWVAVIIAAITEYREWLTRIEVQAMDGKPVSLAFYKGLQTIRRECESKWFSHICDMANISAETVFKLLNKLDREYCLGSKQFNNRQQREVKSWSIRRAKERRLKKHG